MSESHNPDPDSTIIDTFINSLYQTKFIHMYSINLRVWFINTPLFDGLDCEKD
jgi:hypothetical protein